MDEVLWFPGEEEERDGGRDGDDEDVVHPDVVGDGGEEDEEEEDGDGVEPGGEESPDYSLCGRNGSSYRWAHLGSFTKGHCKMKFRDCYIRVLLLYQPCCLVPCSQGKLGELAKKVYKTYCTLHFVS